MKCNSLSPSACKTYDRCEFAYYLFYHLRLKQDKTWAAENGTFCHSIYEDLAKQIKEGKNEPEIYEEWFNRTLDAYRNVQTVTNRFGEEEEIPPLWTLSDKALNREKHCQDCKYFGGGDFCFVAGKKIDEFKGCPSDEFDASLWLIEKVLENQDGLNLKNRRKIIATEQYVQIFIDDGQGKKIKTGGIIDLITELDSETIVVEDYKTGNYTLNYNTCMNDIQFLIYHLAAREKYPQYEFVFITPHWLKRKSGRSPTLCFNRKDVDKTKEYLIKTYHKIVNNEFPRRICDKPSGIVEFNNICKNLCNPELCEIEHKKLMKRIKIK